MSSELPLVSAFLVGVLGSAHCIGMCGGIVGALTLGLPDTVRNSGWGVLPYLFAYNAGRIASYVLAGALVGLLGEQAAGLFPPERAHLLGVVISGVFMVVLGLYVGGWWPGLARVERLGAYFWRLVEPLGRHLLPVRSPAHALGLGAVWGWLPCGLVYTALAFALTAADAGAGAARMAAFGLGTLPMLLAMGAAAAGLGRLARRPLFRHLAGAAIIAFGVATFVFPHTHDRLSSDAGVHAAQLHD